MHRKLILFLAGKFLTLNFCTFVIELTFSSTIFPPSRYPHKQFCHLTFARNFLSQKLTEISRKKIFYSCVYFRKIYLCFIISKSYARTHKKISKPTAIIKNQLKKINICLLDWNKKFKIFLCDFLPLLIRFATFLKETQNEMKIFRALSHSHENDTGSLCENFALTLAVHFPFLSQSL